MDFDRLSSLYAKYGRVIYVRCRRILNDKTGAEDATQEVFLRVARNLDRAPSSAEALMWIYRIATNYCLNERRDASRRPQPSPDRVDEELPLMAGRGIEDSLADRELARRIVARAPPHLRVSAWLYYVDEMSHEEVAKALGVSRRTVINYLAEFHERTRRFLRRVS